VLRSSYTEAGMSGGCAMRVCLLGAVLMMACGSAGAAEAPLYKTEDCNRYTVQMDLNTCAGANAEAADKTLNAVYKQVMDSRSDETAKASLRQSERSWIEYRDKHCDEEVGPQEDGGSIWPMEMSNCLEQETAKRIRVLQRMLTCTAGVSVCNPH